MNEMSDTSKKLLSNDNIKETYQAEYISPKSNNININSSNDINNNNNNNNNSNSSSNSDEEGNFENIPQYTVVSSGAPPHSLQRLLGIVSIMFLNAGMNYVYFGTITIIEPYFQKHLKFTKHWATFYVGWVLTVNFLMAVLGGVLADGGFGKFSTILTGTSIAGIGIIVNTIGAVYVPKLTIFGVFLVAMGNGMTIPCFSAFLGDNMVGESSSRQSSIFGYFYFSVQVGAVVSLLWAPILLQMETQTVFYFLLSGLLVTVPLTIICWRLKYYRQIVGKARLWDLLRTSLQDVYYIIQRKLWRYDWYRRRSVQIAIEPDITIELQTARAIRKALVVFIPIPFFYGVYFQIFTVFPDTASRLDRNIDDYVFPESVVTCLNSLFDMILIPLLAEVVYPYFSKRGMPLTPIMKMLLGLAMAIIGCVCGGILELEIEAYRPEKLSIFWIMPQFFFISVAEVMLTITGLEFAYSQVPVNVRAVVTSWYWLTLALGSQLQTAFSTARYQDNSTPYFISAAFISVILIVFATITNGYQLEEGYVDEEYSQSDYSESDDDDEEEEEEINLLEDVEYASLND